MSDQILREQGFRLSCSQFRFWVALSALERGNCAESSGSSVLYPEREILVLNEGSC